MPEEVKFKIDDGGLKEEIVETTESNLDRDDELENEVIAEDEPEKPVKEAEHIAEIQGKGLKIVGEEAVAEIEETKKRGRRRTVFQQIIDNSGISFYSLIKEMGFDPRADQGNWSHKFFGDRQLNVEEEKILRKTIEKLLKNPEKQIALNCIRPDKYRIE